MSAIIHRYINTIICSRIEDARCLMIFSYHMYKTGIGFWNITRNVFPGFSIILCLIYIGIEITHLVEIHRNICGTFIISGCFDIGNGSPRRHINIFGEIIPTASAILGEMNLAIITSYPDKSLFKWRFSNGEQHGPIKCHEIINSDASRTLLVTFQI